MCFKFHPDIIIFSLSIIPLLSVILFWFFGPRLTKKTGMFTLFYHRLGGGGGEWWVVDAPSRKREPNEAAGYRKLAREDGTLDHAVKVNLL